MTPTAENSKAIRVNDPEEALGVIAETLGLARTHGASQAEAALTTSAGLRATVRLGEVETIEHHRDKTLAITVYHGQRRGSASTTELSRDALESCVRSASDIAQATRADPCAGLADAERLAREIPDLDLYHPWALDPEQAVGIARRCETAARDFDARITNSEGARVSTRAGAFAYGNSHGFLGAWRASRNSISCSVLAQDEARKHREYWYALARAQGDLETPEAVGEKSAARALRRIGARQIGTMQVPVVFEAQVARTLFSHFVSAVTGGNLYRRASFLLDAIGEQVFAPQLDIDERPHLRRAIGSIPFDGDGVETRDRRLVDKGVLQGYLLDAYSARKLDMATTGNSGGVHNLCVHGDACGLADLIRQAGTGVLVTELMGFGVNTVTGDYSRGACGLWFEDGEIGYPVEEITVAGNLKDMFRRIVAVGNDTDLRGNIRTGSVLIERMTVAGK